MLLTLALAGPGFLPLTAVVFLLLGLAVGLLQRFAKTFCFVSSLAVSSSLSLSESDSFTGFIAGRGFGGLGACK